MDLCEFQASQDHTVKPCLAVPSPFKLPGEYLGLAMQPYCPSAQEAGQSWRTMAEASLATRQTLSEKTNGHSCL